MKIRQKSHDWMLKISRDTVRPYFTFKFVDIFSLFIKKVDFND